MHFLHAAGDDTVILVGLRALDMHSALKKTSGNCTHLCARIFLPFAGFVIAQGTSV
jgi:hypothetical protein